MWGTGNDEISGLRSAQAVTAAGTATGSGTGQFTSVAVSCFPNTRVLNAVSTLVAFDLTLC